jgi:hypothetical protein
MKLNFRTIKSLVVAVSIAAVGATTVSCVNDDLTDCTTNSPLADRSVVVKISSPSESTKAIEDSEDGQSVVLNRGHLLFTDAQGAITKVLGISNTTPVPNPAAPDSVYLSELTGTNGATILNIPAASDSAFVIANLPSVLIQPAVGVNISTLRNANIITVESQGKTKDLTLFGGDVINQGTTTNTCAFTVYPLAARIEIAKISGNALGSIITDFQIDGIFMYNYYEDMQFNAVSTANIFAPAIDKNNPNAQFMENSTEYPTSMKGIVYDYDAANGISQSLPTAITEHFPAVNKVWGYNQLAPTSPAGTIKTPKIFIRLSNIKTSNPNVLINGTRYLTVDSLQNNGTTVTELQPSHVYRIKDIKFSEKDIQVVPGQQPINVAVTVTLAKWTSVDTDVILQ